MPRPKIIIIDDEVNLAAFVATVATKAGFDAIQFHVARLFKEKYQLDIDVIILDLMMPDIDGIETIRFLAEKQCKAQLILMSGFDSDVLHSAQTLALEQKLNLIGSLDKPFRSHELSQLLNNITVNNKNISTAVNIAPPSAIELSNAIKNDEFVVYYQPKAGLKDNALPAVEALVRWNHPEFGLILPDNFIPFIEQYDLIDDLTWIVISKAMSQCSQWRKSGLDIQIAINMSVSMLKELEIPEKIGDLIEKYGLDCDQVILEITESALMTELIKSLDILTRLRMKGIGLSIDDFGTGYSSFLQLHRVPFSEIKIDRSFVSTMDNNDEALSIVETIIMLGRKLGMKIVAEGVETNKCKQRLIELGCDHAQGFLFAKPMPGSEIYSWFNSQK